MMIKLSNRHLALAFVKIADMTVQHTYLTNLLLNIEASYQLAHLVMCT